jgi:hypothetical protein
MIKNKHYRSVQNLSRPQIGDKKEILFLGILISPLKVKSDRFYSMRKKWNRPLIMLIKFIKNTLFLLSNQEWLLWISSTSKSVV